MALLARLAFSIPIPDEQHQQEHEEITSFFKNIGQKLQEVYQVNADMNALRQELSIIESDLTATHNNILAMKDLLKETLTEYHDDSNHDVSVILKLIGERNDLKLHRQLSLQDAMQEIHRRDLELQ